MMYKKATIAVFTALGLIVASCNFTQKNISFDTMKKIIWELSVADKLYEVQKEKDSTYVPQKKNFVFYEAIFAKYKVNKKSFFETLHYYETHPDKYKVLLDSANQFANKQKEILIKNTAINKI